MTFSRVSLFWVVGDPTGITVRAMAHDELGLPSGSQDERELLLAWLGYLRRTVLRKVEGLDEVQARWTPDGKLIPLIGIVNHLTRVEWRWLEGGFRGAKVDRSEEEFNPGSEVSLQGVITAYRERSTLSDSVVRTLDLSQSSDPDGWAEGKDLRWVLLHLINETARHAGHADATRELLDGLTGE